MIHHETATEYRAAFLKLCPFCGGKAEIAKHHKEPMWRLIHQCSVMNPIMLDWTDRGISLIERWNTRYGGGDTL